MTALPSSFLQLLSRMGRSSNDIIAYEQSFRQSLPKSGFPLTARCGSQWHSFFPGRQRQQGPFQLPNSRYIERDDRTIPLGLTWQHKYGLWYSQEYAASIPAQILPVKKGDRILDMCASPGGKTIQILNRLHECGGGEIIANEPDRQRLTVLRDSLLRIGLPHRFLLSKLGQAITNDDIGGYVDSIILDAPCSGEGTAFKSQSALLFWRREDINNIVGLQKQLITNALSLLKPGGRLVYSTCTINPYENEGIVDWMIQTYGDQLSLESLSLPNTDPGCLSWGEESDGRTSYADRCIRCLPHRHGTGGFFVALWRKNNTHLYTQKPLPAGGHKHDTALTELFAYFGYQGAKPDHLLSIDDIIAYGYSAHSSIPLAKKVHTHYIPLHGFAQLYGHACTDHCIDIDNHRYQELVTTGRTDNREGYQGRYILRRAGCGLTVVKCVGGDMKGKLPQRK
ncbi:MAG: RsmB/NOP family class I SAM-dependent RNA methyltransferase [Candidatus Absconditabacterales bacterium]|nr:RsmB/NOP family class I SAM-dependent RNA methyltransferase [Candidatus Absconditabacterales bacterium]